jgi:hypothetical protein
VQIDNQSRYVLQGWSATRPLTQASRSACGAGPKCWGRNDARSAVGSRLRIMSNSWWTIKCHCHVAEITSPRIYSRSARRVTRVNVTTFARSKLTPSRFGQRLAATNRKSAIGELLRAFDGGWVRSDLLGIVASAKNFQDDWQRRMRDLRFLGWDYQHEKRYDEGSRVWTYYRLTKSAAWPENISQAIRTEDAKRKARKSPPSAGPD